MAFTEPLFSDGLGNDMAGGPTLGLFKNPDGTFAPGSGVVPPPDSPNAVNSVATGAAVTLATAAVGAGDATVVQLNALITELNAALTIINANTVKGNTNAGAIDVINDWLVQSGSIKPPAA